MLHRHVIGKAGVLPALLVLLSLAASVSARAQERPQKDGLGALRRAFEKGDARAVLQHAARRVEVSVPGSRSQYSRSQAVYVLKKFFEDHPPRRFTWENTATRKHSRSMTGRYWHESAEHPMPVYVRLSKAKGSWQLQEVRIGSS